CGLRHRASFTRRGRPTTSGSDWGRVVIAIGAQGKMPGEAIVGEDIELSVRHQDPEEIALYERLIGDAMTGDATLFARQDSVEVAWAIVDPTLSVTTPVCLYECGTWDPAAH